MELIRIIISVLIPPIGAFLKVGLSLQFFINLLLTICGYFPGLVHVIWLLARKK
ncbi:YqaE/Pmp3 family membrane protein [Pseudodesulfovibrio sediminis]|uniref:Proteolipid membrane potential modulator n=1 Tax=Pseudodesulfovibrio sediminis TaxID=2810563 RepID=A0ABM7P4R9_9BACT|nr:YqaE/Pmp3 family membrane protein [Pseudodesulfovibrio sediminis]BCS87908.1 proteolipid membrane potential modulator [Pseudodesulfovibrio sediminis]